MNIHTSLLRRLRLFGPVVVLCVGLAACGGSDTPLASAKDYLAKNDLNAGIIELKNALQKQPDLAEARFLLGKALLDREDPVGAEVELRKASGLKHPADAVVPLLARALLAQGELRKVTELEGAAVLAMPEAIADLKTTAAIAYAGQGNTEKAEASITAALGAKPDHAPALLSRARMLVRKRGVDAALEVVNRVLAGVPTNVAALNLKGDLLQALNDTTGSTEQYRKVLAVDPANLAAHAALLTQSVGKNDIKAAGEQLEALKKARPKHPQTLYFEARLASQRGDHKSAADLVQQLLKSAPESPQALQLAGVVALRKNELLQAEQHLGKLIQLAPDTVAGRHLLARVYLQRGEPTKVLATLQPILDTVSPDAQTLSLAGSAWLLAGDSRKAENLLARAVKLRPGDASSRTTLARARLAQGDATAGLRELEDIAGEDSGTTADMVLISANLNRRNFDAALKAIDRLEQKQPDKPLPLHLRAQVLAMRGDLSAARTNYAKALAADAAFFPSVEGLATLDLREKKPDQARSRVDAVLKVDPKNPRAMLALAKLDERAGRPKQEVAALIGKAIALNPIDPALRRTLVRYHLGKQDHKLALSAAQDAVAALPDSPEVLEALGRAQNAAGETNHALRSYAKLAAMLPNAPEPLLGVARVQIGAKDNDAALHSVKKALALAPDHPAANRRAVGLYLLAGRHDDATVLARGLQTRTPASPLGWQLLGDIEANRRKWDAAARAYQVAYEKQPSSALVQPLHRALRAGGKPARADALAASWLKERPADAGFLVYLGDLAVLAKDHAAAESRFLEVLKLQPDNAMALNNLAWAMRGQNKPGAIAHAERANRLRPNVPAFMDTWALLLAEGNDVPKALGLQKRAVALAPADPALRLTIAKIHLRAGDKAAARGELERLRTLGDRYAGQKEVQDLLATL